MLAPHVADWVSKAIGSGARIVDVVPLPGWSSTPPWLLRIDTRTTTMHAVLRTEPRAHSRHPGYAREVQALALAERHGIAAPRVIAADLDGSDARNPATLVTALPGYSSPREPSPELLRAYGAMVASLRTVRATPMGDLQLRHGPIDVERAASERRRMLHYRAAPATERQAMVDKLCGEAGLDHAEARDKILHPRGGRSSLLESAEQRLGELPVPEADTVLVHADLHLGNTMWIGEHFTGMVDWDAAGVGHECIDLGLARLTAVLECDHDPAGAAHEVLHGWHQAAGVTLDSAVVAYWDARATLNGPAKLGLPDTQARRRDAFLTSALRVLDHDT